jgi:poly-gamma-glutamate synthesis protein (capsule biosynthesis protein)
VKALAVLVILLLNYVSNVTSTIYRILGNEAEFKESEPASVILVGDIMLGRTVMTTSLDKGDLNYPFRQVAHVLSDSSLVFANLENPFVTNCPRHTSGFKFCTDPSLVNGLNFAGIDVVTIANNHTRNYGQEGFNETKTVLTQNSIAYVGDNNIIYKEVDGTVFAFLGFDFLTNKPKDSDFTLIQDADKNADVVIVGVHWGEEYKAIANNFQKLTAKKLIESGADVIAGHHPHWVQDSETINGKRAFYSLGNFVFDQMWSEETKKGLLVRLTFDKGELIAEDKMPIYMENWAQPAFRDTVK